MFNTESSIRGWRNRMRSTAGLSAQDIEELESHLRDGIDDLEARGLPGDEAFLLSVKRLGDTEVLRNEFEKVSADKLWPRLFVPAVDGEARRRERTELFIVAALVLLAGLLGKIPSLFVPRPSNLFIYVLARNAAVFALLPLALYFWWKRSLSRSYLVYTLVVFAAAALLVNLYPAGEPYHAQVLTAVHLPIALWILIAPLYIGPGWRRPAMRMDFVRFTGEAFVYSVLVGLGGASLVVLSLALFGLLGIEIEGFVENWVMIFGGFGLVCVAAFLVERKKTLIESFAPVLAKIFVPLFLAAQTAFLAAILFSGTGAGSDREILIVFDILLAVVLGLLLYTMSARDADAAPGGWDGVVFALIAVSIVVDVYALFGIVERLSEYGSSMNKLAALGENLVLFFNLGLLAAGYIAFLRKKITYQTIVDTQMRYLPVYALWALAVVAVLPVVFGFS